MLSPFPYSPVVREWLRKKTQIKKITIVQHTEGGGEKTKGRLEFSKTSLKTATNHLIENCYFNVGSVAMKEAISIPLGIDPAPFWANLFLHSCEEEYMSSLISSDKIKTRHFHSTECFIDDLCAISDGGEFVRSICEVYPKKLELKVENHSDHATFLNLDITIQEGAFVYKLFNKRDSFPIGIARSTLSLRDFIPKSKGLLE